MFCKDNAMKQRADHPLDVYVNGGKAFTFLCKDIAETSFLAGEYDIQMKLAGIGIVVGSVMNANIPAGVDISIQAKLSAEKTPILLVMGKYLTREKKQVPRLRNVEPGFFGKHNSENKVLEELPSVFQIIGFC